MTIEEHLDRIVARCHELLALAEKRTQGRWVSVPGDSYCAYPSVVIENGKHLTLYDVTDEEMDTAKTDFRFPGMNDDAAFIAACAGAAEAMARSTISICDELLRILTTQPWESEGFQWADQYAMEIIAAWPEEQL